MKYESIGNVMRRKRSWKADATTKNMYLVLSVAVALEHGCGRQKCDVIKIIKAREKKNEDSVVQLRSGIFFSKEIVVSYKCRFHLYDFLCQGIESSDCKFEYDEYMSR